MALGNTNFVALFVVSYVAGITGGDFSTQVTDNLDDVAHVRRVEFATNPEWYSDGMRLLAYEYNGYKWNHTDLTWAIIKEPQHLLVDRVITAAKIAFQRWSTVTGFYFERVTPKEQPDIRISFEELDEGVISDTIFPTKRGILDFLGVNIVFNDLVKWTAAPGTEEWYNIDYALLFEVTRVLGAEVNLRDDSLLHMSRKCYKMDGPVHLFKYDVRGIQRLYNCS